MKRDDLKVDPLGAKDGDDQSLWDNESSANVDALNNQPNSKLNQVNGIEL